MKHPIARLFVICSLVCSVLLTGMLPGFPSGAAADDNVSMEALKQLREKVHKFTLSNGIRVIMYRRGIAPVFSGIVGVRVGGTDEVPGKTGISHMFEHMAFKGTSTIGTRDYHKEKPLLDELEQIVHSVPPGTDLPPDKKQRWDEINKELAKLWTTEEFTREYEKRGASGMNATTDTELTRYFVSLPRTAFEFWCSMESARLIDPVLRQFYQERDVVMEERRMRTDDSPEGKLYEELLGISFLRHPYHHPVIGYANDIRKLTATDVDNFRRTYYVPSNIVVALVGDVDEERDRPVIESYFGALKPGPTPPRPDAVEPPQDGQRDFTVEYPSSPVMYVAYHKPTYPHPDDAPISVMSELLAGSTIAPMYTELVKKRQVATSVDVEEAPGSAYPNLLVFSITPKAPHTNVEVLRDFDSVVKKFMTDGVTQERLDMAKRAIAVSYLGKLKSSISMAIDLASTELTHGDWQATLDWFDQVMKVSRADISRVAKTYLSDRGRIVGKLETMSKESALKGAH